MEVILSIVLLGLKAEPEIAGLVKDLLNSGGPLEPTAQQLADLQQAIADRKAAEARVDGTA